MVWVQQIEHRLNQVYQRNVLRVVSPVQRDSNNGSISDSGKIRFVIEKRPFYAVARWNRLAQQGGDALLAMDQSQELLLRGTQLYLLVNHVPHDPTFSGSAPKPYHAPLNSQFDLTRSHLDQISHIPPKTYLPLYQQHREARRYVHCEFPPEEHLATRLIPRDAQTCAILGGIYQSLPISRFQNRFRDAKRPMGFQS